MTVTHVDLELLRRLSEADGPPGAEGPVRDILRRPYVTTFGPVTRVRGRQGTASGVLRFQRK